MELRGIWEWISVFLVVLALSFNLLLPFVIQPEKQESDSVVVRGYAVQHGGYEPKVIRVKANETVRIIFYAMDLPQSLSIEELNIDSGVVVPDEPGMDRKVLEINFTRPGVYVFRNSVPNGPMSPFQVGYIVVEGDE